MPMERKTDRTTGGKERKREGWCKQTHSLKENPSNKWVEKNVYSSNKNIDDYNQSQHALPFIWPSHTHTDEIRNYSRGFHEGVTLTTEKCPWKLKQGGRTNEKENDWRSRNPQFDRLSDRHKWIMNTHKHKAGLIKEY